MDLISAITALVASNASRYKDAAYERSWSFLQTIRHKPICQLSMESFGIRLVYFFAYVATDLQLNFYIIYADYCHVCGVTLPLQGQCLKCSLGCNVDDQTKSVNVDDQTKSELNAPSCHKVRIPYFTRLMILMKGIF